MLLFVSSGQSTLGPRVPKPLTSGLGSELYESRLDHDLEERSARAYRSEGSTIIEGLDELGACRFNCLSLKVTPLLLCVIILSCGPDSIILPGSASASVYGRGQLSSSASVRSGASTLATRRYQLMLQTSSAALSSNVGAKDLEQPHTYVGAAAASQGRDAGFRGEEEYGR